MKEHINKETDSATFENILMRISKTEDNVIDFTGSTIIGDKLQQIFDCVRKIKRPIKIILYNCSGDVAAERQLKQLLDEKQNTITVEGKFKGLMLDELFLSNGFFSQLKSVIFSDPILVNMEDYAKEREVGHKDEVEEEEVIPTLKAEIEYLKTKKYLAGESLIESYLKRDKFSKNSEVALENIKSILKFAWASHIELDDSFSRIKRVKVLNEILKMCSLVAGMLSMRKSHEVLEVIFGSPNMKHFDKNEKRLVDTLNGYPIKKTAEDVYKTIDELLGVSDSKHEKSSIRPR